MFQVTEYDDTSSSSDEEMLLAYIYTRRQNFIAQNFHANPCDQDTGSGSKSRSSPKSHLWEMFYGNPFIVYQPFNPLTTGVAYIRVSFFISTLT